ncbi:MAG: translation initiation factor IF-2 [Xanthomonadales bacterium]|nr:translation initiation factor IF-2 [Xanthomonadales bacterium]
MSQITVAQLAEVLGVSVDKLLEQFKEAGIEAEGAGSAVSNESKRILLTWLRSSHGKQEREVKAPRKVTLKRKSFSELKVSGSGPRASARTVNVEVRKKRTYVKRADVEAAQGSNAEREAAQKALDESRLRRETQEQEIRAADEAKAAAKQAEQDVLDAAKKSEQDALNAEAAEQQSGEDEVDAKVRAEADAKVKEEADKVSAEERRHKDARENREKEERRRALKGEKAPGGKQTKTTYGRKQIHVARGASARKKPHSARRPAAAASGEHAFVQPTEEIIYDVAIPESITVSDLAKEMAVKATEVIKVLMGMGAMVTINQSLDQDTATLVVEEMGHNAHPLEATDDEKGVLGDDIEAIGEEVVRPPVVTIMGHVDHGKTSLLDYIRKTHVTEGEAGGITQHIGAYHVTTDNGQITFLDTPGHAAFTSMRARGAQATDIVILVVAADDGVMPQTKEAIQHSRAAGVPIIVAVNKIDRENADPEKVKNELSAEEVIPEDWGGEEQFVSVSAITGEGVDSLLDAITVQAELMELKAWPENPARGLVVEASLDKGRGPVSTILIQDGTLKKGDMILAGTKFGRVRAMFDESGTTVTEAGPSMPVAVLGLSGVPEAGDSMIVAANERRAREVAQERHEHERESRLAAQQAAKLQNLFDNMGKDEKLEVNVLVKADVQGSVEALKESLIKMSNDDIEVNVISSGVGGITESDATLAHASQAILIGFNVRADAKARKIISDSGLDLRYYSIIYDAIDDVKQALIGTLGTETKENILGTAEVKDVFRSSRMGPIAGCIVTEGVVRSANPIRVLRDNVVIYEGELESLRRHKDDVSEVKAGTECGIGVKQYNDVRPGDSIECFERIEVQRTLDAAEE